MPCLTSAILNTSPAKVSAAPFTAAVAAIDRVSVFDPVTVATTAFGLIPVPVTFIPTATPAIEETAVIEVLAFATLAVGVTVALKQWPPAKSSDLKLVAIAVVIPAMDYFLIQMLLVFIR